jgi:ferredoxin-NADP reductase
MVALSPSRRLLPTRGGWSIEPPKDLQGRRHHDRAMAALAVFADAFYLKAVTTFGGIGAGGRRPPDAPLRLQLVDRRFVTADESVVMLTFTAPGGGALPPWQPGCHLDFHLDSGRRRQYSLCGDPADREVYQVAVRAMPEGAGGSLEMHALAVGESVTVRGPRNAFLLVPEGAALFIAGGIGITPILPMVRMAQVAAMDWHLLYVGKDRASMPFLDEVLRWGSCRVTVRTDDELGAPTAANLLAHATDGAAVYCCGPGPMIDAVRAGLKASPATALHYERFTAPPIVNGTEFAVELARSGQTLTVPADKSVLEVVKAVQPGVGYSCQQGFCGTCKVRVLAGQPVGPGAEDDAMLICVTRTHGDRLVLDL